MEYEILLPSPGESVSEAEVAVWHKKEGDLVARDELLLEVETDKATLEIMAEYSGKLHIVAVENAVVPVGGILGKIVEVSGFEATGVKVEDSSQVSSSHSAQVAEEITANPQNMQGIPSPSARKMMAESNLNAQEVEGTGKGGRIIKGDVIDHLARETKPEPAKLVSSAQTLSTPKEAAELSPGSREENPVPIPRIRKKIAERLKAVQNTAAILTTFNEVDMSAIMQLREEYKDTFEKKHGIKLGFMGFFVKAAVEALRRVPDVNAEWREDTLVYKNYQDIGVAVSTGKGLVVPVVRNAADLSLAGVEKEIARLAQRGRDGTLGIDEMSGGTFTITNGGVFGSLLSTPILNPPQTAILGMHKTERRPIVVGDEILIRPMMYVAMSYDHRVIDGKEAVQFLVTIKECIENPVRILLEV